MSNSSQRSLPAGRRRLPPLWRALGVLALAVLSGAVVACEVRGSSTSERVYISEPTIVPEGVWKDLIAISAARRGADAGELFTRRRLLMVTDPEWRRGDQSALSPVEYPTDDRRYRRLLGELDGRLTQRRNDVRAHGEQVASALATILADGGVFIVGDVRKDIRQTDSNRRAVGPNTARLKVHMWPSGVGRGEPELWEVEMIQEYEHWRIDRITPDPLAQDRS